MKTLTTFLFILLAMIVASCDFGPGQPATPTPALPAETPTQAVNATAEASDPTATLQTPSTPNASAGCMPTFSEPATLDRDEPPMRASVGSGHVLSGVVKSSADCSPIPDAKVIFWLTNSEGVYVPENEGTLLTEASGGYRIESEYPGQYEGTQPHIHMLVSADGFQRVFTTLNLESNATESTYDIVLPPAPSENTPTSTGGGKPFPTEAAGTSAPAPGSTQPPSDTAPQSSDTEALSCAPTRPDGEGPYYVPNAPVRSSVGTGHLLKGMVRSSKDCSPLPNARIEFWQVGPNGEYDDAHRATLFADDSGAYTFESNFPPGYSGRPPHIHAKVTASGHQQLTTQFYPSEGATEAEFDLVLIPE
jgi:protocatechuate 3,4-dioxygenase beta subunit